MSYYALAAVLTLFMPFIGVAAIFALEPIEARYRRGFVEKARARLAAVNPIVVGVAGSYGKTTTKAALAAVLSAKYRVLATPESYNTLLGVTRTINEQLTDDIEVFIVEMGARHPGDIAQICDLVQPKYGVITRLGPQHLEYFKTPETIVATKTELARSLPADGIAIVDADGYSDFASVDWPAKTIRVSAQPELGADVLVGDIAVSGAGTTFSMTRRSDGERLEMTTKLLGRHAAFNSGLAVVAGLELGIDPIGIRSGLSLLKPVSHRLEIVRNDSVVVIDDAFSSNPDGFAAALEVLGSFPGRRILITPRHDRARRPDRLGAHRCRKARGADLRHRDRRRPRRATRVRADAARRGVRRDEALHRGQPRRGDRDARPLAASRRCGAVRERPARQLRVAAPRGLARLAVSFARGGNQQPVHDAYSWRALVRDYASL